MKAWLEGARARLGAWQEERRAKAAERRAQRPVDPVGAPSEALIRSVRLGAWGAYAALMWFLWERVLAVSESQYETLRITNFLWLENLTLSIHFPLIVGYVFVVLTVPYIAKFAIPMMVSLSFRQHFWAKSWAIFITLLVSVVLITGTATVGGMAVVESERDAAVAVEQTQQQAAVLDSRIEHAEQELAALMNHSNVYTAIAASMTPAEYERTYITERPNDWQRERFRSALGASRDAAALRQRISDLRDERATATVTAAVSSDVVTSRSAPVAGIIGWLNAFWILLLAVVMDIACLFLPWLAETLQQRRNQVLGMAEGIAPHPYMIPDMSASEGSATSLSSAAFEERKTPMDPHYKGDLIYDEAGRELRWVEGHVRQKDRKFIPGHYRPTGVRRKQEIEVTVGGKTFTTDFVAEDKPVAHDGGGRAGSVADHADRTPHAEDEAAKAKAAHEQFGEKRADVRGAEQEGDDGAAERQQSEQVQAADDLEQDEPPPPDDDLAELYAEAELELTEPPVDAPDADQQQSDEAEPDHQSEHVALPENEGVMFAENDPEREPETRADRLIAAE